MSSGAQGSSGFGKYAYNLYGTLNDSPSDSASPWGSASSSRSRLTLSNYSLHERLTYAFNRETTTLSPLSISFGPNGPSSSGPHHVVVGGRNCLRLLVLSSDQHRVIQDLNLLEKPSPLTSQFNKNSFAKLSNINTLKCDNSYIACGLSNGNISVYKMLPSGKAVTHARYTQHNRCINSLDFFQHSESHLLLSGLQDGAIKLWDLRASLPRPVQSLTSSTHLDPVRACQYSPHSHSRTTVLSVHDSGSLCKFDLRAAGGHAAAASPALESRWSLHTGPALSLHIHPTMEYVLTGGRDQRMCVWNYSDSIGSANRLSPQHTINTHGPVRKVRWSRYPNEDRNVDDDETHLSPLHQYDFACLFLNDDTTLSVYNLLRKFIPRQIITSASHKPFLNFVWAGNKHHNRVLWTLTKSNVFTSYDLDTPEDAEQEISWPIDDLPKIAVDWDPTSGHDLSMVSQETHEFDLYDPLHDVDGNVSNSASNSTIPDDPDQQTRYSSPVSIAANSNPPSMLPSLSSSPVDRPSLIRSFTQSPGKISSFAGLLPRNGTLDSSMTSNAPYIRPRIRRDPSQTTQGSHLSDHSRNIPGSGAFRRLHSVAFASPYVLAVDLPLPFEDEFVFDVLALEYLVLVPDQDLSLLDVCMINADTALQAGRHRDSLVWRLLAVALEEEQAEQDDLVLNFKSLGALPLNESQSPETAGTVNHLIGSYDSESSQFIQYGAMGATISKQGTPIVGRIASAEVTNASSFTSMGSFSGQRVDAQPMALTDATDADRSDQSTSDLAATPSTMPDNLLFGGGRRGSSFNRRRTSPFLLFSAPEPIPLPFNRSQTAEQDLDDENAQLLRPSPSFDSQDGSDIHSYKPSSLLPLPSRFMARRGSWVQSSGSGMTRVPQPALRAESAPLVISREPIKEDALSTLSKLTTGLLAKQSCAPLAKPWRCRNVVLQAIEYASSQGDIVLCSTLCLLFYHMNIATEEQAMEWLLSYIEMLQRRRLYTSATNILNVAPLSLAHHLKKLSNEVDLRFYCALCHKLLVNENSKHDPSKEHGYWFCEECLHAQPNCIYCCEPCHGLALVVSLRCGHRGHYGCLKEWFVMDENVECPGGCEYTIV